MPSATSPPHFPFVDAMRGYAILAVLFFHAGQLVPDRYPPFPIVRIIASHGGTGVQLFFVISAFSLFWSLKNRQTTDRHPLKAFFARRVFRVAPLFWLGIVFYLVNPDVWRFQFAPNGVGPVQVIATVLFVHGWYPSSANSVVPGGWSIGAEMMFYLTLPFLFQFIRSFRTALIVAMLSSIAAAISNPLLVRALMHYFPPSWTDLIGLFVYSSFPMQFPVFCWGIVLYYLVSAENRSWRILLLLACAAPFLAGPSYLLLTILFIPLARWLASHPASILVHRWIRFVGLVSYSMYIWHFFILDNIALLVVQSSRPGVANPHLAGTAHLVILFMAVSAATILTASVSYYLIERPFINLGRWLIAVLQWGPVGPKEPSAVDIGA